MEETRPGLWHWTAVHPKIRIEDHYRQSGVLREEFGCRVFCHEAGLHGFEGGPVVEGFRFGDRPGARDDGLSRWDRSAPRETALHIDLGEGLLSFADGLINHGRLGFVSDGLLGDDPEGVKRGLRDAFRALLDRDFDSLLFAHGNPLLGGGKQALREFVDSS
jgi:hypothetical protein